MYVPAISFALLFREVSSAIGRSPLLFFFISSEECCPVSSCTVFSLLLSRYVGDVYFSIAEVLFFLYETLFDDSQRVSRQSLEL